MDELKVIDIMNETTIELLKEKKANYEENMKISNYLKDEAFFFKIDKPKALEILLRVGVKQERLEDVYKKLIAPSVYYDLLYKGKINENDTDLIIKYKKYESSDLFKKTN